MKKKLPTDAIANELSGASAFFQRPSTPDITPQELSPQSVTQHVPDKTDTAPFTTHPSVEADQEESKKVSWSASQSVNKEVSIKVRKFTSKLVNDPRDPAVNKVGYYFTRREVDQLDALTAKLKPILRDHYNVKMTKNEIVRACLAIGLADWEENELTSKLVYLLTSK